MFCKNILLKSNQYVALAKTHRRA